MTTLFFIALGFLLPFIGVGIWIFFTLLKKIENIWDKEKK